MPFLIGIGLAAIAIMITVDGLLAEKQKRKPNTGSVMLAGFFGIAWFVALVYANGGAL